MTCLSSPTSAVDIITNRSDTRYRHDKFCRIKDICGRLKAAGVTVHLGWIPAHVGISKNQDADKHAKEMAARVAKGLIGVDNKTAFPDKDSPRGYQQLFGKLNGTEPFREILL